MKKQEKDTLEENYLDSSIEQFFEFLKCMMNFCLIILNIKIGKMYNVNFYAKIEKIFTFIKII